MNRRTVTAILAAGLLTAGCGGLAGGSTVPTQIQEGDRAVDRASETADRVEQLQNERMDQLEQLDE